MRAQLWWVVLQLYTKHFWLIWHEFIVINLHHHKRLKCPDHFVCVYGWCVCVFICVYMGCTSVNRWSAWETSSTVLAVTAGTAAGRQYAGNCYQGWLYKNKAHTHNALLFDITAMPLTKWSTHHMKFDFVGGWCNLQKPLLFIGLFNISYFWGGCLVNTNLG